MNSGIVNNHCLNLLKIVKNIYLQLHVQKVCEF